MAFWGGYKFQNLVWIISSFLESLHDLVMIWLVVVLSLVLLISFKVFTSYTGNLSPDSEVLEKSWTIVPILILLTIVLPSIYLLCLQDSSNQTPNTSVKIIGNQWNWQSETTNTVDHLLDFESVDFMSSYESPLLINTKVDTRMVTVSTDVLHSLGVPSLGLKLDAAPGRMSMVLLEVSSPGVYIGSCYELCGSGHSAMPIQILSI